MCVQCDARSLSGFRFKSSFQGRFLSISLHVPGGMLTVAALSDLASVFTTPGAQVTPLPASYGNILTHLSLEIRLVACFHTEICFVTKVTFLGCLAKKKGCIKSSGNRWKCQSQADHLPQDCRWNIWLTHSLNRLEMLVFNMSVLVWYNFIISWGEYHTSNPFDICTDAWPPLNGNWLMRAALKV